MRDFRELKIRQKAHQLALECQLLLTHDLGYLPRDHHTARGERVIEVKRVLHAFHAVAGPERWRACSTCSSASQLVRLL